MELKRIPLKNIIPYPNNPRKNDGAVDAVAESIKQCQYITPIVVDEDMVILAGHTRYKALKKLGRTEAEIIIKEGLTEEQKRKYRLLDNKTNEFAFWDDELLEFELEDLDFEGFDFGFGNQEPSDDEVEGGEVEDRTEEPISVVLRFKNAVEFRKREDEMRAFFDEIPEMTVSVGGYDEDN